MSSRRTKQSRVDHEEGLKHIARYIESFESKLNEIWLVFRHEGISLSKLLYTADEIGSSDGSTNDDHIKHVRILHPSKWWRWLKATKAGQDEMRNLIWQLLTALKACHDRNITHRDIKPVAFSYFILRIIDFGSAMDEFTTKHLYGSAGPSRDEQTYEYMPPEAFLNATWYHGPASITTKYDMWSVGVVILELIIGSPNVFQINAKTHALLERHLEGWSEGLKELAYKLRSFMELCILLPGSSSKHLSWGSNGKSSGSPASWKCSEEFFSSQIKSRDPLKIGFPNVWALRLVRQLLVWDPIQKIDDSMTFYSNEHNQFTGIAIFVTGTQTSLLNAASITAALIDVNVAQSKLVLLENFNENYSKCLRLLYKVNAAEGVNAASEEVSTTYVICMRYFDMNQDSAHMVAASKVPMLKPGKFELWRMRIEQYIQMIDYALSEVIENGATLQKTAVVEGVEKDAKLLLKAVEKRFRGNAATKKTQRNLLKLQYENFTALSSEMLDQTFDRLQNLRVTDDMESRDLR
ncbi:protein phosphatase 2C family protein [Tanacetum coccineum]